MCSIPKVRLPLSSGTDLDFEGGDITSDGGIILVNEFCTAIGLQEALRKHLEAHPMREYDDWHVAYQRVIMLVAGYLRDVDAERLDEDPAFAHVLGDVASQPTLSRRLSAMGESDAELLRLAIREVQGTVAKVAPEREFVVVDVDSTLAPTFGKKQEGSAFNYHYQANGYHPLVATDTLRRECIDIQLRKGTDYCSKGSGPFIERVLDALAKREPHAWIGLRGDSGFAAPEVYLACERKHVTYAVRLKVNRRLVEKALARTRGVFKVGVARTFHGSFTYRAGSWDKKRRVVFEAVQREGQLFPEFTFVVTNSDALASRVMAFYRGRGAMEQIIGEVKEFGTRLRLLEVDGRQRLPLPARDARALRPHLAPRAVPREGARLRRAQDDRLGVRPHRRPPRDPRPPHLLPRLERLRAPGAVLPGGGALRRGGAKAGRGGLAQPQAALGG